MVKSKGLAVAVVRMQVDELHAGHKFLIESMRALHEKVLIVLGASRALLSVTDPLPVAARRDMIQTAYPDVTVTALADEASDVEWSKNLDWLIGMFRTATGTGIEPPTLYGARDSFIQHYKGMFPTCTLTSPQSESGTDVRNAIQMEDDPAFRRGMIFAAKSLYPISFQTVDAAIIQQGKVLLGRKNRDGGGWRFIGGFVDPTDASLEDAILREVREETGLEVAQPTYIGSYRIDDPRYPKTGRDRILTAFFSMPVSFGFALARDDVDAVAWFDMQKLPPLVESHWPLGLAFRTHFFGALRAR
jgi:bifunctional NMN adenylyltransferase/nudix hydrolase